MFIPPPPPPLPSFPPPHVFPPVYAPPNNNCATQHPPHTLQQGLVICSAIMRDLLASTAFQIANGEIRQVSSFFLLLFSFRNKFFASCLVFDFYWRSFKRIIECRVELKEKLNSAYNSICIYILVTINCLGHGPKRGSGCNGPCLQALSPLTLQPERGFVSHSLRPQTIQRLRREKGEKRVAD